MLCPNFPLVDDRDQMICSEPLDVSCEFDRHLRNPLAVSRLAPDAEETVYRVLGTRSILVDER